MVTNIVKQGTALIHTTTLKTSKHDQFYLIYQHIEPWRIVLPSTATSNYFLH